MKPIKGIITALATPFLKDKLDKHSFKKLLKGQIFQQVDGFVINGTTGESPSLYPEEVEQLFNWTKEETKNIPIILGVGGNGTTKTLLNIKRAEKLKADGVLAVVPYYNNPPQRGIVAHFKTLAYNSPLPIILYNVPSRTKVSLSLDSILELSKEPNIIGIKEASGDLKIGELLLKQKPKNFTVLSGDDDSCFDLCALGAEGVVSVVSHILTPEMKALLKIIKNTTSKNAQIEIKKYKQKYSALFNKIYCETNPIGIKMALKLIGVFNSAQLRSPLVSLQNRDTENLKIELNKLGIKYKGAME